MSETRDLFSEANNRNHWLNASKHEVRLYLTEFKTGHKNPAVVITTQRSEEPALAFYKLAKSIG